MSHAIRTFPSPVGVLHVSIDLDDFTSAPKTPGFRPLSGSYMFLYKDKIYNNILQILFPSPVGVLHVSIPTLSRCIKVLEFPSPVGVLHVSIFSMTVRT